MIRVIRKRPLISGFQNLFVLVLLLSSPRLVKGQETCESDVVTFEGESGRSVLVDGVEIRSCVTPVSRVTGKSITTLEGLPAWYARQKGLAQSQPLHPLQQAFIDVQAVQCGACYNGMTVKGAELLSRNPKPTEAEIRLAMNGHLCRCGTYPRILKAIQLASAKMSEPAP